MILRSLFWVIQVKANAMVTRGGAGFNQTEVDAYINVFMYAQQFYGLKGKFPHGLLSIS